MFAARIDTQDSRYSKILDLLHSHGLYQWMDVSRAPIRTREFTLEYERIYDLNDLDVCEYLELSPMGDDMYMRGEGRIARKAITQIGAPGKADLYRVGHGSNTIVAIQRARDVLNEANLIALRFLPVEKNYESVDQDLCDAEDMWWELESDLQLPPLSPSMTLETRDGRPFRGDFSEGCLRCEGFYTHPELHYRRADLERFGPFDAARTYEHYHPRGPAPRSRAFVVSHRFYETCGQHNIRTRFVPVRIDE